MGRSTSCSSDPSDAILLGEMKLFVYILCCLVKEMKLFVYVMLSC